MNKLFFLVLLLIVPSVAYGGIEYVEELQFNIPMLEGAVEQFCFNDIDNDGYPEILATDGRILLLYSITNDSIIFIDTIPDAIDNVLNYKILLDDVNRDNVADIIFGRYCFSDSFMIPSPSYVDIYFYEGGADFNRTIFNDFIHDKRNDSISSFNNRRGFVTLEALDLNNDNYNEIVISVEDVISTYNWGTYWYINTEGLTNVYHSFPDSIYWIYENLIDGFYKLPDNNFLSLRVQEGIYDTPGSGNGSYLTIIPTLFDSSSNIGGGLISEIDPTVICGAILATYTTSRVDNLCFGNIDNSDENLEIIYNYFYRKEILCNTPVFGEVSESGRALKLSKNTDSLNFEEQWSIPIDGLVINDFLFHPGLPGYFFAFQDDVLTLYRGSNGSIHQQISNTPVGSRQWAYPFDDSIPRLIVTDSNTVTFYHLDIATDVNDNNNELLPNKFSLSQNYPNPFNPTTTVKYYLPTNGMVNISIYNLLGQRVATIVDKNQVAGAHEINWDGSGHSSGIYLIKAEYHNQSVSDHQTMSVKAVLLK